MMKKMLFVINPKSGRVQIKNKLLEILDLFIKDGYEVRVHVTQASKDAQKVVLEAGKDQDMVVCSGGDGTLNEVVTGLMELEHPPLLGYIPSGSTNDFASSLHIPKNTMRAAHNILTGKPYDIDVGQFCEKNFIYIAAFGAFTEVSYMTSQDKKNLLGHQAYMLEGVKSLTSMKPCHMKLECEETSAEGDYIFGMITNTISVGGFKGLVTQDVSLNDGYFEVLMIRNPKTPIDLSNIISYMFLKEEENEYVLKFKTRKLNITSEEPVDWVLDGEFGGSRTEVTIENLQKRMKIMRLSAKKTI